MLSVPNVILAQLATVIIFVIFVNKATIEGFKIRGIFQYGFKMLEAYTRFPECTPQRKGARIALRKLLQLGEGKAKVRIYIDSISKHKF